MGGALIKGWAKAARKNEMPEGLEITVTAKTQKTLDKMSEEFPELHTTLDNTAAAADADIIILAVKPWLINHVVEEITPTVNLNNQIIVSVAANIQTSDLRNMFHDEHAQIFYAMPNIAAEFGESMTFVAGADGVSESSAESVRRLFSLVGAVKVCVS